MKNKTRVMSLAACLGLLTATAGFFTGCNQNSSPSESGSTPPAQNSMAPSEANTNVPGSGMNTNSSATTSTNTP